MHQILFNMIFWDFFDARWIFYWFLNSPYLQPSNYEWGGKGIFIEVIFSRNLEGFPKAFKRSLIWIFGIFWIEKTIFPLFYNFITLKRKRGKFSFFEFKLWLIKVLYNLKWFYRVEFLFDINSYPIAKKKIP